MAIARECGIPKSSAHHLLNVMRARRFVTYYETERAWGLGAAALEIGSAYPRVQPLQRLGGPILTELTQLAGQTSHLAILHGADVLYIGKQAPATPAPKLITGIGVRLPAHLTAVGRAMLAQLDDAQIQAIFDSQPLVRRTGHGRETVGALLGQLHEIRRGGLGTEDELITAGVASVAAPVFSHDGGAVAAVGVTYGIADCPARYRERFAHLVRDASLRLSVRLGARNLAGAV